MFLYIVDKNLVKLNYELQFQQTGEWMLEGSLEMSLLLQAACETPKTPNHLSDSIIQTDFSHDAPVCLSTHSSFAHTRQQNLNTPMIWLQDGEETLWIRNILSSVTIEKIHIQNTVLLH